MIEFPLWFGGLGWAGCLLFWAVVVWLVYLAVKWLNNKL